MKQMQRLGSWAFIIGLVIAIIAGLSPGVSGTTVWVLAVLGVIVGLLNVTQDELRLYLLASITFLVSASSLTIILSSLDGILQNIIVFVAPGAAIVALKALYDVAKDH